MGCLRVRGDNSQALASGLSYIQVDNPWYNYFMVLGHFGHGHFGLGRFGLDISATENAKGGRFGHKHNFWVWDNV